MRPWHIAASLVLGLAPSAAYAAHRPVVVELFTSEGCSSCPPADAYLTELSRREPDVLPLAFHVTYWNHLGWSDPFSLAAATQRQQRYGSRFGDGSYTPEMVVDGRKGFVGSDRDRAEAAIAAAAQSQIIAAPVRIARAARGLTIKVGSGQGAARIVLVGFDRLHQTAVGRGENGGRTLVESNIVRSIQSVGDWEGPAVDLDVAVPSGQEAAVLLEAPDGSIVGAARLGAS